MSLPCECLFYRVASRQRDVSDDEIEECGLQIVFSLEKEMLQVFNLEGSLIKSDASDNESLEFQPQQFR